ncbi:hypothetical protein [Ureibacillus endophyticus]|uniref:Uncharacterized protein n=1 Tax=Ureibacillus endophyticus TaxID=1978490 RepID=A0A494YTK3_9BACL|nr:hypothetical protein [Lysinibacillus endophyticus]RKQ13333.1 hypothetical protein D8M03_16265 [Lysinibacillus endophyticus]
MNSMYIGFQKDNQLYGSFCEMYLHCKFNETKEALSKLAKTNNFSKLSQLFDLIEWKQAEKDAIAHDGTLLFKFIELGNVDLYEKYMDNVFKKLTKNGSENIETGEIEPIDYTPYIDLLVENEKAVIKADEATKDEVINMDHFIINIDAGAIECNF